MKHDNTSTDQPPQELWEYDAQAPGPSTEDSRQFYASQGELIRWRFSRHKMAVISLWLLALLYFVAIFADFLAPYGAQTRFAEYQYAKPTRIHWSRPDGQAFGAYIYRLTRTLNTETYEYIFEEDPELPPVRLQLLVRGDPYKFLGLWRTDLHLFGPEESDAPLFLFGSDQLGRDLFTRVLHGARISLSIGLVGVFLTFILGILIGSVSGYFGGVVDEMVQRVIDFLLAIPGLPLWMTLAAAVPRDWPTLKTYFAITVILSIIGWCGLARVVRGKLLQLREEDYALAAKGAGASDWRIITHHLLPGFTSHLIVSITFSIPSMILSETSLSFIGVGIQPPAVSWGTLLQDSQDLMAVAKYNWLLIPALWIIATVLLFNFVGDGLRDAADPYSR